MTLCPVAMAVGCSKVSDLPPVPAQGRDRRLPARAANEDGPDVDAAQGTQALVGGYCVRRPSCACELADAGSVAMRRRTWARHAELTRRCIVDGPQVSS
jgi:hypothetical protein